MASCRPKKLKCSFYNRPTLQVARELLGMRLVYHSPDGLMSARIVETEAYIGQGDGASHAAPGRTKRNSVMFGPPGHAYIYLIYGMYHCLNFVTEKRGFAAAVLIRAAEVRQGLELMNIPASNKYENQLLSGPGKLCRSFGLSRKQNGLDITSGELVVMDYNEPADKIGSSPRVGVRKAADRNWRFFDVESSSVSTYRSAGTSSSGKRNKQRGDKASKASRN